MTDRKPDLPKGVRMDYCAEDGAWIIDIDGREIPAEVHTDLKDEPEEAEPNWRPAEPQLPALDPLVDLHPAAGRAKPG